MRLTLPQQDIYFEQLLFPNEPIYNIGAKIEIIGALDIDIMKEAYISLINSNDAYRTVLNREGEYVNVSLLDNHNSELGLIDFSEASDPIMKANKYMQQEFKRPFDLLSGDLLHVFTLLKVKEEFYYLFSVYHHIITDGWGTSLMFQRLVQNYNEIYEHGKVISSYPFTYKTFVEEDLEYETSPSFTEDLNYWFEKFKCLPENLLEKLDHSNLKIESGRQTFNISRNQYNKLAELAQEYKCSTFHVILGVLYVYFGRKHNNIDFAIGLPVLNRNKSIYKKTVGLFMGISPLRMTLDFDASFRDLMTSIRNQLRQDYRHQRLPLGKLIQKLQLYTEKERLFNITLSYEKQDYATHFINTRTRVIPLSHHAERAALAIYIREFDDSQDVAIDFDYNRNYFHEKDIGNVITHVQKILTEILLSPDKKLKELSYLTKEEEYDLIYSFNKTKLFYKEDITFLDLFYEQVRINPGITAIEDGVKTYLYSDLDKLSSQIAAGIISKSKEGDNTPIAVLLERSVDMIAVLVGILKTGRSYIPLDPGFPLDRLQFIVDDSQANVIIYDEAFELDIFSSVTAIPVASILGEKNRYNQETKLKRISTENTAYIIYTSGSTGQPKGVEIGHKSLLNFLISMQKEPGIIADDTLFSVTTHCFDISILEFFLPLISGANVYVATKDILENPKSLINQLNIVRPTIIQGTPSFFQMLLHAGWKVDYKLKILCGGDLLSESLSAQLLECSSELWNMYGPTETTIWSSIKKIEMPAHANIIGKPISNTQIFVLDRFLYPKPVGIQGDIYIAGDGLAKGYYRNEKLTNEKFISNPFNETSLCYMTGDLGKFNSDGEVEILGRIDNQVKVRGYRIELGEIEAKLNQMSDIKDSIVIAKKGEDQESFLVAYILKESTFTFESRIIERLKRVLPYYMVPNAIIVLDEFPLTLNNKVDRKTLSQRSISFNLSNVELDEPICELEIELSKYFKEIFNTKENLGVTANFFALGGHSLMAVRLIELISKNLSVEVPFRAIFDNPTISLLAKYIKRKNSKVVQKIPISETRRFYDLTPSQQAIWLASQKSDISIAYNMSASFKVIGEINIEKLNQSVQGIIDKYEILRTNFIEVEGIPKQKIKSNQKIYFQTIIQERGNDPVEKIADSFINTEFNLETDILLRMLLIKQERGHNMLIFCTHHIIMDGLSLEIFIKELIQNYNDDAVSRGSKVPLRLQFKDYSEWLIGKLEERSDEDDFFWDEYLKDYYPSESIAKDFDVKGDNKSAGQLYFEVSKEVVSELKQIANENQVTFYSLLAASTLLLINKVSDCDDVCIEEIDAGRFQEGLNDQLGMFAQTFLLRNRITPGKNFKELLSSVNADLRSTRDHFPPSVHKVGRLLIDLLLVYQNPDYNLQGEVVLKNLTLIPNVVNSKFCRRPIVLNLFESNLRLNGVIEYNADLYDRETIKYICSKFIGILKELSLDPNVPLETVGRSSGYGMQSKINFDFDF